MTEPKRCWFLAALLCLTVGCGKPEYSYKKCRKLELEALETYKSGSAAAALAQMDDLTLYAETLCQHEYRPNSNAFFAVLHARQAFLYDHLGDDGALGIALARCRERLSDIVVRGEGPETNRLDAFLHVVAGLDRGIGANWGPTSSLLVSTADKTKAEPTAEDGRTSR